MNVSARALLLVVGMVLLAASCGGDDGGGGSSGSLLTLLGAIPDTPETAAYVSYADLAAYYDAIGIDSPPSGASDDEMEEWARGLLVVELGEIAPIVAGSPFVQDSFQETEAFQAEIGLDAADIEQEIEAGTPPETYTVLRGDFDSGAVNGAVRDDPGFSDLLQDASHGEVSYYTWGEDFEQDFARNSPVHTLGRGGRLALHDDLLFWCFWTDGMNGMIDAATEATDSLADREDFAAMSAALDDLNVYTVQMTDATRPSSDSQIPMLAFFDSYAVGGGTDGDGPFLAIAIANPDEATATENVDRLQNRFEAAADAGEGWATGVESIEARSEGVLTIAVLRGENLPWDFVQRNEENHPLMHEARPE